ncbi:hypothetical protein O181_004542 [Austropuccinia psidii MF-1]|uniref:Uncharacterized protein n=1 Tax=Austropuccinia psidii MF-1 TaxID=1389203 RepID=A0A9Q3BGF9_9BASI|nr:hypothetical protein [Austropuccinia psidii MF-1]
MEDSRASTSYQMLARTFDTLLESPESYRTPISVVRSKQISAGRRGNIPVSVQELVYGGKTAIMGASAKPLDRKDKFLSTSEEVLELRKDRGNPEKLDSNFLQRVSPTDKSLVEKHKHIVRGPEEAVGPKEGKQPYRSSSSFQKQKNPSTSAKQGKASPKEQ